MTAQVADATTVLGVVAVGKFRRMTFMPASSILASISLDSVLGPMVQTILVFSCQSSWLRSFRRAIYTSFGYFL